MLFAWRFDRVVCNLSLALRLALRLAVVSLKSLFLAAQASFDLAGRMFEARIRLVRASLGVQRDAGTQAQGALGLVAWPVAADDDGAPDRPVKVVGDHPQHFVQDVLAQGFPDVEVLARNSQSHRCVALTHFPGEHRVLLAARFRANLSAIARPTPGPSGQYRLGLEACRLDVNRCGKGLICRENL